MRKVGVVLLSIVTIFIHVNLGFTDDYYVDAVNGKDTNSGLYVDDAWKTITGALSKVSGTSENPAIINIATGTYHIASGETFPLAMDSYNKLTGSDSAACIIDAVNSGTSAIKCIEKETIFIENLTIKGGSGLSVTDEYGTTLDGGGVYCLSSNLEVIGCKIKENNGEMGVGIFLKNSEVIITDSLFTENKGGWGGGIYCYGGNTSVDNCIFTDNTAEGTKDIPVGTGGGIRCHHNATVTVTNCQIEGNNSNIGGGICSDDSTVTISACKINNNTIVLVKDLGGGSGGGIGLFNTSGSIDGCEIIENTANWGGGLLLEEFTGSVTNTNVEGNKVVITENSGGGGAGIYCNLTGSPEFSNCTIKNNIGYEGTGFVINNNSSPNIDSCEISGNKALWGGGFAIYANSSPTITNCLIENNTSEYSSELSGGGYGGGINCIKASANISFTTIKGNSAMWGAGFNTSESIITIKDSVFEDNNTILNQENDGGNGGGIVAYSKTSLDITASTFKNNSARWGAGISLNDNSTIDISDCIFDNNQAEKLSDTGGSGGALYSLDSSALVNGCQFYQNSSFWGACMSVNASEAEFSNSSFSNNHAGTSGGVLYIDEGSNVKINNDTFDSNTAKWGAVFELHNNAKIDITSSEFNNNEAQYIDESGGSGGVINIKELSTANAINCLFESNKAYWGASICSDNAVVQVSESIFSLNYAEKSGGGIYADTNSNVSINHCKFDENQALWGGGIFAQTSVTLNIVNSSFLRNTANYSDGSGGKGGGIDCEEASVLSMINCLIENNNAVEGGGLFFEINARATISNSTLVGNTATDGPAAYSTTSCNTKLVSSIIRDNGDYPVSGSAKVTYTNIEGGYEGNGNIDKDPKFVTGPWGDYYLSQKAAGQSVDSPCINAGSEIPVMGFTPTDYINRTDGVVDTGRVDMGYHYQPHVRFGLALDPVKANYTNGDNITLNFDVATAPVVTKVNIYLIMVDPDGNIYSALAWNKGLLPLVEGLSVPKDLDIEGATIANFVLPSTKPPISKAGTYTFYMAALKPGTVDFISNIATASCTKQ
jgi:predicted outer membrane repeat protein